MNINNAAYGGFMVSKNILAGKRIKYSFREESELKQLNGWMFFSEEDDDAYVNNPKNFVILSAESMYHINPLILELFDAPYGTDLCWLYEKNVHNGFYDLKSNKEVTLKSILLNQ